MSSERRSLPTIGTPRAAQLAREIDRRLTAEGEHHAARVGRAVGGFDFVGARRLEDQHVGNIEIGRDGLRIVVDDDRRAAGALERPRRVHAAVIELDALADANRAAARRRRRPSRGVARISSLFAAREIIVGRLRRKLGRRGIDHPKRRRASPSGDTVAAGTAEARRRVSALRAPPRARRWRRPNRRALRARRARRVRRARNDRSPRARAMRSIAASRSPRARARVRRPRRAARASDARRPPPARLRSTRAAAR